MSGITSTEKQVAQSSRASELELHGEFIEPANARASVVFVHGCGSARHSPHDRAVAEFLTHHGFGALLLDILTPGEEAVDIELGSYRFNPEFLAHRLTVATDKLVHVYEPELPVAYIGIGSGAAAALIAASRRPVYVKAVICRSGTPDLAGKDLALVRAPTLFVVGSGDRAGVESNQRAYNQMPQCERDLVVIPGGSHLLDEPASIQQLQRSILRWLNMYVGNTETYRN